MNFKKHILLSVWAVLLSMASITLSAQASCSLACLDKIGGMLNSEGEITLWPLDFTEVAYTCPIDFQLEIKDENGSIIFSGGSNEPWTGTQNNVNIEYTYTITDLSNENTCWGNIIIVEYDESLAEQYGEDPCNEIPLDFSSFHLDSKVEFSNTTIEEVYEELIVTMKQSIEELYIANGTTSEEAGYVIGWSFDDTNFQSESNSIRIIRKIQVIDFCHANTNTGLGFFNLEQEIIINNPKSISLLNIMNANKDEILPVNEIVIKDDEDNEIIPDINTETDLKTSILQRFEELQKEIGSYSLKIEKYDDCTNGLSSLDLVLTTKHILGLTPFDQASKIVAADFDENGAISVSDIIKMKNIILGVTPCNDDSKWRFFKSDLTNATDVDVNELSSFNLNYNIEDEADIEIIGIKKGDVNLSIIKKAKARPLESNIYINDLLLKNGHHYEIPVYTDSDYDISSLDLNIFKSENLEIKKVSSGILNLKKEDYFIKNDKLNLVWFTESSINAKPGEQLFVISIQSKKTGLLSNLLETEWAQIQLYEEWNVSDQIGQTIFIKPFTEAKGTTPNFNVHYDGSSIHITGNDWDKISALYIYDMTGRLLFTNDNIDHKSYSEFVQYKGMATLQILSGNGLVQTEKIILQ